ncbi:MAG: biotin--[acetyl-CoA-carboxylase] ligase [Pseudomonadota bacterium]
MTGFGSRTGDAEPAWLAVLRALSADGWTSGEELAARAGVTRAAIWKQVGALEERGIPIDRSRGRGYRLTAPVQLLDAGALGAAIAASCGPYPVRVLAETASTNSWLRTAVKAGGIANGTVCVAESQHAGRGRRGRAWAAAAARNVALSVYWRFASGLGALGGLSVAIGAAIAEALEPGGAEISLKWPNDLITPDGKLGGILIEADGEMDGPADVIVGIGVNLDQPGDSRIDQAWTDLAGLTGAPVDRNAVTAAIAAATLTGLARFEDAGLVPFLATWDRRDALRGRHVRVTGLATGLRGMAVGIGPEGQLLVDTGAGIEGVHGGEISVRSAAAEP